MPNVTSRHTIHYMEFALPPKAERFAQTGRVSVVLQGAFGEFRDIPAS